MITFTKEQLIASAHARIEFAEMMLSGELEPLKERTWSIELELARIALASLEAEPVAYVMADDLKDSSIISTPAYRDLGEAMERTVGDMVALYSAPPVPVSVPDYPETLPCPVTLEPGLKFGKGVSTRTMLGALQRRAEFHAELEAMTPEQRAEHDAGMKEFAAMLQGADGTLIGEGTRNHPEDNLDMVDHSGDTQETRFKPVADLFGLTSPTGGETSFTFDAVEARDFIDGGWSCQEYVELERFQEAVSGNSPVIPDGWVLVPMEPTEEMCDVGHVGVDVLTGVTDENEYYSIDGESAAKVYRAMIAAAPKQEVKP